MRDMGIKKKGESTCGRQNERYWIQGVLTVIREVGESQ